AGDVHLMHALVADVAVAVVPDPVPVVVDGAELPVAVRHLERRRAAPQVVVHRRGRLLLSLDQADAAARLVAQGAGDEQLAQFAGAGRGGQPGPRAAAAALGAVLDDAIVLAGDLDGDPPLVDVVAARLLDVDVLTGLAGPDGHQGVPVVGRSDGDG